MYEKNDALKSPMNPNIPIWRYMDFAKFVSLLHRRAIFFTSVSRLVMSDPYEGVLTRPDATFRYTLSDIQQSLEGQDVPMSSAETLLGILNRQKDDELSRISIWQQSMLVSCWHMNEFESAAMWRLYSLNDSGIAIKSTFSRLSESFIYNESSPVMGTISKPLPVYLGEVEYLDYENDHISSRNAFLQFMSKRKSFAHERELRAITWIPYYLTEDNKNYEFDIHSNLVAEFKTNYGLYFPIDLPKLIEQVFIAPTAPKWVMSVVQSVLEKYAIDREVIQSDLLARPQYYSI